LKSAGTVIREHQQAVKSFVKKTPRVIGKKAWHTNCFI